MPVRRREPAGGGGAMLHAERGDERLKRFSVGNLHVGVEKHNEIVQGVRRAEIALRRDVARFALEDADRHAIPMRLGKRANDVLRRIVRRAVDDDDVEVVDARRDNGLQKKGEIPLLVQCGNDDAERHVVELRT